MTAPTEEICLTNEDLDLLYEISISIHSIVDSDKMLQNILLKPRVLLLDDPFHLMILENPPGIPSNSTRISFLSSCSLDIPEGADEDLLAMTLETLKKTSLLAHRVQF